MGPAQLEPKPHTMRALSTGREVEPRAAIDFSTPPLQDGKLFYLFKCCW